MPCTACGKTGIATNVTKPKSMILGMGKAAEEELCE